MDIKQKLGLEQSAESVIRLYREGIFYVAYNHSALRFKKLIHPEVKILKHVLKCGDWYLRMGVVQTSAVLDSIGVKDTSGGWLDYIEVPCDALETSLADALPDKIVTRKAKPAGDSTAGIAQNAEEKVLAAIRTVDMANLTPWQALVLLGEWQGMLKC